MSWLVRAAQSLVNTPWRVARPAQKAIPGASPVPGSGGWYNIIREPFTGAWQRNISVSVDTALTYSAVFRCINLISSDIAKMRIKLVRLSNDGVWTEVENSAFSPVLRKPNRWQTRQQFVSNWMESKLIHGNTYVLKGRDNRGVVTSLTVLDPNLVTVRVASDSTIFYELRSDHLTGQMAATITVPASEIIHDRASTFHHPLVGVSPITAAGLAIASGMSIQQSSAKFFAGGGRPSGVLAAPGFINQETALRLKEDWNRNYGPDGVDIGKVAVLGDGLEFKSIAMTAADAQLIEQLRFTAETVASVFVVPLYMIGIGQPPTYNNVEALQAQFYAQCLQQHIESIEALLDEGLGLGVDVGNKLGTEFDLDGLLRMDSATRTQAAANAVKASIMAPNEARARYFDLPPTEGGDSPLAQQQLFALSALAERDRDKPFSKPSPAPEAEPPPPTVTDDAEARRLRELRSVIAEFHALADDEIERGRLN